MVIAERFFSSAEMREILALPTGEQLNAFYTYWTRKEAYLKGIGTGLEAPLDQFTVPLATAEPIQIRSDDEIGTTERNDEDDRLIASTWLVHDIAVPPRYFAALAIDGKISHLHQWEVAYSGQTLAIVRRV